MPMLKIVNGGTGNVVIGDTTGLGFTASIGPSATKYVNVTSLQLETMGKKLEALRKAGVITYFIVSDAVAVTAGVSVAAAETAPDHVEALGPLKTFAFHVPLPDGGAAGAGDEITIFAAGQIPFKMRIVDAYIYSSEAGAGGSTLTLNTVAGAGAGNVVVGAVSTAALGLARAVLQGNVTTALTPAAAQGLFATRSDRDHTGELILIAVAIA